MCYLIECILERLFIYEGEADKEHVSHRVTECAKSLVVILSGGVPKDVKRILLPYGKLDRFLIYFKSRDVVIEHGRNVLLRESVLAVAMNL